MLPNVSFVCCCGYSAPRAAAAAARTHARTTTKLVKTQRYQLAACCSSAPDFLSMYVRTAFVGKAVLLLPLPLTAELTSVILRKHNRSYLRPFRGQCALVKL